MYTYIVRIPYVYYSESDRKFKIADARIILDEFNHKSIWSGKTEKLTITRIDKTLPLTINNAMVVTINEALRHPPLSVLHKASQIHKN